MRKLDSVAAAVAGSVAGQLLAGPMGGVVGAGAGPVIQAILESGIAEFRSRKISSREDHRVASVAGAAASKIEEKLAAGFHPREDFFTEDHRSADELLEAVLSGAQRTYEERKLPFFSSLFANIAFDTSISMDDANYMIRLLNQLSYRQLVLLANVHHLRTAAYVRAPSQMQPLINELNELANLNLVRETQLSNREGEDQTFMYRKHQHGERIVAVFGLEPITEMILTSHRG